jgi:hypothetical protein
MSDAEAEWKHWQRVNSYFNYSFFLYLFACGNEQIRGDVEDNEAYSDLEDLRLWNRVWNRTGVYRLEAFRALNSYTADDTYMVKMSLVPSNNRNELGDYAPPNNLLTLPELKSYTPFLAYMEGEYNEDMGGFDYYSGVEIAECELYHAEKSVGDTAQPLADLSDWLKTEAEYFNENADNAAQNLFERLADIETVAAAKLSDYKKSLEDDKAHKQNMLIVSMAADNYWAYPVTGSDNKLIGAKYM